MANAGMGVLTSQDPGAMTKSIAAAVHKVDPDVALAQPRTMEQVHHDVLSDDRFTLVLFACFAAIALLLAALGIYGVMTFLWHNARTRLHCAWRWERRAAAWWRWCCAKA